MAKAQPKKADSLRVRYAGPYRALVVDGVELARGGEADLAPAQYERIKDRPGVELVTPQAGESSDDAAAAEAGDSEEAKP